MSPTDASFLHIEGASEIVAVEVNRRPSPRQQPSVQLNRFSHLSGINRKSPLECRDRDVPLLKGTAH
jgi:hypothetical protein